MYRAASVRFFLCAMKNRSFPQEACFGYDIFLTKRHVQVKEHAVFVYICAAAVL